MVRITNIDDLIFHVELRPIYTDIEIDGKKTQLKVPNNKIVINSKSGKPLGVVSNSYKLISNSEAIELEENAVGRFSVRMKQKVSKFSM